MRDGYYYRQVQYVNSERDTINPPSTPHNKN